MTDTTDIRAEIQTKIGVNEPALEHSGKPWLFRPGVSGNPLGRPKGSKNKLTKLLESVPEQDLQIIVDKFISAAKWGRVDTLNLFFKYMMPKPRQQNISLIDDDSEVTDLKLDTTEDIKQASEKIIKAMIAGRISVAEAQGMVNIIDRHKDIINA